MNPRGHHSITHRLKMVGGFEWAYALASDPEAPTKQVQALIEKLTTWKFNLEVVRKWRKVQGVPAPHGGARPQKKKIKNLTTK